MKDVSIYFENCGFLARYEIETLKEAVKVIDANMDLVDRNGNHFWYDMEINKEDEDDTYTDYKEPTEQEVINRIQEELNDENGHVYYGVFVNVDKFTVVPSAKTHLFSNFYIGQKVYVMHDNKIKELYVSNIMLAEKNGIKAKYHRKYMVNLPNPEKCTSYGNETVRFDTEHTPNVIFLAEKEEKGYSSDTYFNFGVYPETEVFASKKELVSHLMNE